jgi:hypothetical protein
MNLEPRRNTVRPAEVEAGDSRVRGRGGGGWWWRGAWGRGQFRSRMCSLCTISSHSSSSHSIPHPLSLRSSLFLPAAYGSNHQHPVRPPPPPLPPNHAPRSENSCPPRHKCLMSQIVRCAMGRVSVTHPQPLRYRQRRDNTKSVRRFCCVMMRGVAHLFGSLLSHTLREVPPLHQ